MKKKIIGIDIGATKTRIGVVEDFQVVEEVTYSTSAYASKNDIVKELIENIEKISGPDPGGIGIGVPGLIDEENGIIYDLWNIPSWQEVILKKHLQDHFNIPVRITNDANTFALGEKIQGQGKKYKDFVGITLGAGFGTGLIINHQLYSGTLSGAGEIGAIPYLDKTIEDYCSGKYFRGIYGVDGRTLYERAQNKDGEALRIFREFGSHIGNALLTVMYFLAPQAIILGGSVSRSFPLFEDSLWEKINTFPFKRISENLEILASGTANVSILGAAALINHEELILKDL